MRSIIVVLVLAGCGDAGPTCSAALGHAAPLVHFQGPSLDAAVAACERGKWPKTTRACLVAATAWQSARTCLEPVEADLAEVYRMQSDDAGRAAEQARTRFDRAQAAVGSANAAVAALVQRSEEIGSAVDRAVVAVASAKSDAELAAAKAKLQELERERADVMAKLGSASAAAGSALDATVHALEPSP